MKHQIWCHFGNNMDLLAQLPDNSVDSIVTDPPYGLGKPPDLHRVLADWVKHGHHDIRGKGFMGKEWDAFVPQPAFWKECLRVLKPGGHLLAFAGTRTQHLMATSIQLAGFEIRDMTGYIYGSGFPKSQNISKAIDKKLGAKRKTGPINPHRAARLVNQQGTYKTNSGWSAGNRVVTIDPPATEAAAQWDGWGTALKPALEPITIARKPIEGTVAQNVLKHGTGAINIDGCRVDGKPRNPGLTGGQVRSKGMFKNSDNNKLVGYISPEGRWPANLIHDGSKEVMDIFPIAGNNWKKDYGKKYQEENRQYGGGTFGGGGYKSGATYADSGSAARFFYCAKASRQDRNEGLESLPDKDWSKGAVNAVRGDQINTNTGKLRKVLPSKNNHVTVKPTSLMRYLCRLVTPPNGIVLDPFMGSGSTGKAAILEGYRFIGAEQDQSMKPIVLGRLAHACKQHTMFGPDYSQARQDLLDALNSCNNL